MNRTSIKKLYVNESSSMLNVDSDVIVLLVVGKQKLLELLLTHLFVLNKKEISCDFPQFNNR